MHDLLGPFRREEDQSTYYYDVSKDTEVRESELPVPSAGHIIPAILIERLIYSGLIPGPEPPAASTSCLTFHGWWFEDYENPDITLRVSSNTEVGGGVAARHATLEYDLHGGAYNLVLNNSPKPASSTHVLSSAGMTRLNGLTGLTLVNGQPAGVWDLHVGQTVRVLGRAITLKKASLQTAQWHEQFAKKLLRQKAQLLQDLQKYKPRAHAAAVAADKGSKSTPAGLELRRLALQVRALAQDLMQYRPSQGGWGGVGWGLAGAHVARECGWGGAKHCCAAGRSAGCDVLCAHSGMAWQLLHGQERPRDAESQRWH